MEEIKPSVEKLTLVDILEDKNEKKIKEEITKLTNAKVYLDELMKKHTTFNIGGKADIYVEVDSVSDLKTIIEISKKYQEKLNIIANGSNILVSDEGLRGITVKICFDTLSYEKTEDGNYLVKAYAGASLIKFCRYAAELGVGPIHKIYGIPGSVGGAIRMNAGAYGQEMKDIVYETCYMDMDGNTHIISNEEHNFGYRQSVFGASKNMIAIYTIFKLQKVDKQQQEALMKEIMATRIKNQPLDYPSAGSTFKRLDDAIVSKLIDDCGLKGTKVGGAEVSEKHAGFIINKGGATAKDVLELVDNVKKEVFTKTGKIINLEVIVM